MPRPILRPIDSNDANLLRKIYIDSIQTQAPLAYTPEQVRAWVNLALLPGVLDRNFEEGKGWISGNDDGFAIRHPKNRLSLIYCRGRSSRQGHGSALLETIERDAHSMGISRLHTEASLLSRPMLEQKGWTLIGPQSFTIADVAFVCFMMEKSLD